MVNSQNLCLGGNKAQPLPSHHGRLQSPRGQKAEPIPTNHGQRWHQRLPRAGRHPQRATNGQSDGLLSGWDEIVKR